MKVTTILGESFDIDENDILKTVRENWGTLMFVKYPSEPVGRFLFLKPS